MMENGRVVLPKAQEDICKCFVCPQPKDIQQTVTEESKKKKNWKYANLKGNTTNFTH